MTAFSPREHEPMLGALARSAERANTPTGMILFCAALLLAAAVFLITQARDASDARAAFRAQEASSAKVRALKAEIERVRAEQMVGTGSAQAYEPRELLGAIDRAAQEARLKQPTNPRQTIEDAAGPLQRKVVNAGVRNEPAENVLDWINAAAKGTPGLHVAQINLRTSPNDGWDIEVRFARWELKK